MYFKEEAKVLADYIRDLDEGIRNHEERIAKLKASRPHWFDNGGEEWRLTVQLDDMKKARARAKDDVADFMRRRDRHLQMILEDAELKAMMESTGVSFDEPS